MKRRLILIPLVIVLLLAAALWAPWMTKSYAEARTEQAFTTAWQQVADGCGFNCQGCGVKTAQKTWFGYRVEIEYACGLLPEDSPQYHQTGSGFVSFLGTVHGLPVP